MAAYASLISLTNTVDQVQRYGDYLILLDGNQVESLLEKVRFLQDYLENCSYTHVSSERAKAVERRIADAAHAAEDVIESHAADEILVRKKRKSNLIFATLFKNLGYHHHSDERSRNLSSELRKAIKELDSVKKMVLELKIVKRGLKHQNGSFSIYANPSTLLTKKHSMVGFDEYLIRVMECLTGNYLPRRIIPIIGMGGIGKTTLARSVYDNPLIVQNFDIRAWVTVSQEYSVQKILLEILSCLNKQDRGNSYASSIRHVDRKTDDELGQELYKILSGRMYLIVMDDMWCIEAWDGIKFFFPDNNNKSRVIVTTRLSNLAVHFGRFALEMDFLDEDKSWDLFCKVVFGDMSCPDELEEIGKRVVRKCKGLPLSIVVIGGLLAKSGGTKEYWSYVSGAANSILSSGDNEHCSNILSLSYNHLPVHLKPCFLYTGCFPEDHKIHVPRLVKLWVAEGFLKANSGKTLEEIGEGYFKDLVDRKLILVHGLSSNGKVKTCKIHDLLRDLCLRVAREEKFLYEMGFRHEKKKPFSITRMLRRDSSPQDIINREWRRIVIHHKDQNLKFNDQTSIIRSVVCNHKEQDNLSLPFKLLRVLNAVNRYPLEAIYQLVNLRYIAFLPNCSPNHALAPLISSLWNVQTIILRGHDERIDLPLEIWEMPQLRHIEFDRITLPDPPEHIFFALENLQTLSNVVNFKCTDKVSFRICNVKRLKITYDNFSKTDQAGSYYGLQNFARFNKLESLSCFFDAAAHDDLFNSFIFPSCLKKLTLGDCRSLWEHLSVIGKLPLLEVLKLEKHSVVGSKWNPVEGEFSRLKFLKICYCALAEWNVENTHFPVLESLVLEQLFWLNEIPPGIGDIPTLRSISLENCSESAVISARKILEEQESSGYEDLRVRIVFWNKSEMNSFRENMEVEGFASNNFQVSTSS